MDQPIAVFPAMLCPYAGRGEMGAIGIFESGEIVWLSEQCDLLGKPMFIKRIDAHLIDPKARFGGRINLMTGEYLIFSGGKRRAQEFLAAAQFI